MEAIDPSYFAAAEPERLIGMFLDVAQAREKARALSYERARQRTLDDSPHRHIYDAWQAAETTAHMARLALSKTIENNWVNRLIRLESLDEHHRIAPMSHTKEYSPVYSIEGTIIVVPGYEECHNVLFVQAHEGLPYYVTKVLNNQHEPLIAITLLDQEEL